MKILPILGSPPKTGKTVSILKFAEEKIIEKGHEIIRVNSIEKQISDCLGCCAFKGR